MVYKWTGRAAAMMLFAGFAATAPATAMQTIVVNNPSFEDSISSTFANGGIWIDADFDPDNADFWIETGPVGGDLDAFPPELIPPEFTNPGNVTLDTGVFINSPQDGQGQPNPTFIQGADGLQVAFMFASSDLTPGVAFTQHLDDTYEEGKGYTMTVGAGKSFFLPPIGGSINNPALAVRLLYEDDSNVWQVLAEQTALAGDLFNTQLTDVSAVVPELGDGSPAVGRRIGIQFAPLDGSSGVWTLDNVRLTATPEPATLTLLSLMGLGMLRTRRRPSRA